MVNNAKEQMDEEIRNSNIETSLNYDTFLYNNYLNEDKCPIPFKPDEEFYNQLRDLNFDYEEKILLQDSIFSIEKASDDILDDLYDYEVPRIVFFKGNS